MTRPLLVLIPLTAFLAACADHPEAGPINTTGMPNAELALQRSIDSTTAQLRQIGAIHATPVTAVTQTPPLPDDVTRKVWFVWNGPLNGAVKKLGKKIGYTVTISGKSHRIAVVTNAVAPAIDILRSMGEQAGAAATVRVDTQNHQIEVAYNA